MYQEATTLIIIGVALIMAYLSHSLESEDPTINLFFLWIRMLFLSICLSLIVLGFAYGHVMLEAEGANADLITLMGTGYISSIIISFVIITLTFVMLLKYTLKWLTVVNKNKDIERYGKE